MDGELLSRDTAVLPAEFLVVDLDGTLLRSDMLFETYWSGLSNDWRTPLACLQLMVEGRAAVKSYLAEATEIDVTNLPYNPVVIDYIKTWRAGGGRTALVTASDHAVAERIAAHLGLFDDVYGSDGTTNLKGGNKAAFLAARFADTEFTYIGDTYADLPVWQCAAKAIAVDPSARLAARVNAVNGSNELLHTRERSIKPYIRTLRPHQWLKNLLIFVPMITAHQIDAETMVQSLLAFIAFSLIASGIYVINDLLDLSADRAHPRKKNRPLASGDLPIAHGMVMTSVLLAAGAVIALSLGPQFTVVMLAYFIVTSLYSLSLKRKLVIDICVLAGLYTLRIIAGGAAAGIHLSVWLLAFSIFIFFSLAAVKRQAELVDSIQRGKIGASGRGYHVDDLAVVSQMATASGYVSVLVLALYVNSPNVVELYGFPAALWIICLILLYWISRIVVITHRGEMHDDPVVFAASDRTSQVCFVLIAALVIVGVYL